MSLAPGSRLGPYEIQAALGAGGMGEVYRARDTTLNRDVAIKILPESFSTDPDRLARFQREAHVLASLNHPHIAQIYGLEQSGGVRALVMELVEGEDLAQRIARGPIPIEEALPIAKQIADALDAAHKRGIIHRDVKPANIKILPDETVKVLDFGLAKAMDSVVGSPQVSQSPTITTPAMVTGVGVILGTAAYMSPEQAKGRAADTRSDAWAFGCVLYEMLTGVRAFHGDGVSDTLAAVLRGEPDWNLLRADVPPAIRTLLRRCLEKDSKHRIADLSVASFLLGEPTLSGAAATIPVAMPERASVWRRAVPLAATAIVGAALATLLTWSVSVRVRETPLATRTTRFQVPLPEKTTAPMFQLSPDGRYLAVTAAEGSRRRLWVRPLDALDAQPLSGTDDATYPFWSPDSAFIAFFAQGKLKKIALAGGPPQTLCDAPQGRGGTWSPAGVIVFATLGAALYRVPATGGVPAPVTTVANAGEGHRFPSFLPGATRFLFVVQGGTPATNGIYVGARDDSPPMRLLPDESRAVYVPSDVVGTTGLLVFRRSDGTLMAQPFNSDQLTLAGEMYPLAEQVAVSGNAGNGAFSVSENGVLAYSSSGLFTEIHEFRWRDRTGKRLGVVGQPDRIQSPALSPDEKRVSFNLANGSYAEVWLHDVMRGLSSPFTTRPGLWQGAVWSADGKSIILGEGNAPPSAGIYERPSNGTGKEELLFREPTGFNLRPLDWSRDGKFLVYQVQSRLQGWDLFLLPLDGDRQPVGYLQTPANETLGQFSPDGRWIAYASDESGTKQVYVQPIPADGDRRQISTAGGDQPRWRRDGRELFYLANDQTLMAVPVKTGVTFEMDTPRPLFQLDPVTVIGFAYQPTSDGQRFLVTASVGDTTPPITVVLNWVEDLKRLVPTK